MIVARSHAQRRDWRQPRSAKQLHWARPRQAFALGAHAREPTQWPHACDRCRATHRALPACTPSNADYILRLQHTEPESLEIMLRLLVVALPLVVAFPAAFDEQEVNALQFEVQSPLQFEVQSPLQFEVRSPPESRPLLPAATQDLHKSPATHSTPRAQYAHSAQHPSAPITIHAPRH